jgi:hypothetical protein
MADGWENVWGIPRMHVHLFLSVCVAIVASWMVRQVNRADTRRMVASANAEVINKVMGHDGTLGRFAGRLESLERQFDYLGVRVTMLEAQSRIPGPVPPPDLFGAGDASR